MPVGRAAVPIAVEEELGAVTALVELVVAVLPVCNSPADAAAELGESEPGTTDCRRRVPLDPSSTACHKALSICSPHNTSPFLAAFSVRRTANWSNDSRAHHPSAFVSWSSGEASIQ